MAKNEIELKKQVDVILYNRPNIYMEFSRIENTIDIEIKKLNYECTDGYDACRTFLTTKVNSNNILNFKFTGTVNISTDVDISIAVKSININHDNRTIIEIRSIGNTSNELIKSKPYFLKKNDTLTLNLGFAQSWETKIEGFTSDGKSLNDILRNVTVF